MGSYTSSSLTLRALLKAAAGRLGMGVAAGRVTGLTAAAKSMFAAAAAVRVRTLLVVPTDADVETATADVRFFLSALEGLSDTDVERVALPFPSQEVDPYRGLAPHFEIASARARALHGIVGGQARLVVASAAALLPRVSAPERIAGASLALTPGQDISPMDLGDLLAAAGYSRQDPVDESGEFCVRGGVVDFYPAGARQPIRLEFIGDTIESIRAYDPATQRSTAALDHAYIVPLNDLLSEAEDPDRSSTFFDYLWSGGRPVVLVSEPDEVRAQAERIVERVAASHEEALAKGIQVPPPSALMLGWEDISAWIAGATALETLAIGDEAAGPSTHVASQPALEFAGRLPEWVGEIRRARERGDTIVFVAHTQGRAERTIELLADYDVFAAPIERAEDVRTASVLVAVGQLSKGFRLPDAALQVWAETDIFEEERRVHERRRQSAARTFISDFRDLKVGDHVVHVDHGIGVFVGLKKIDVGLERQEFMELRYAGEDKLFVPVERLDLVQKYTGAGRPALDKLGGTSWEKAKTRVKKAMRDMAEELLKLYAARKAVAGHAFSPDSHWQQEFEDAFEWELTVDQQNAIADIKRDMEVPSSMDRLLCGDVGYGKTEVAMRAAFKAVMDGKQVAFLAPTTVLAFQHLKTLSTRFAAFPVRIDMISRFRTKAEQNQTLADMAAGKVEIIVGTHRLLSKDVRFRDLGLLVVDEEQRFGVAHKEKIKQLRKRVDVLTMTATPIPRTLNMSLAGIRDMSIIESPPKDRLSIQTNVVKFDQEVIRRAIRTEVERGGQVYFVHNRVESIYSLGNLISRLVPEARIVVGHGQMSEDALERAMVDFVAQKYDVLLATTIIENGLDIPNANTIIINRADRYGLAQLYQLRGRVGRSDRRAYAYLLIPPEEALSPVAKKRLAAIREFSDLGSGFRVAALDLEIRGAGNLLGGEQSGHIEAVGFDMYMKLLEQTIKELKGEETQDEIRANVNLRVDLRIEEQYIPDMNQRLTVYRRMAAVRTEEELQRLVAEVRDRYGPPPESVLNLAEYASIRVLAEKIGLESLDREGQLVVLKFRPDAKLDPAWLFRTIQQRGDVVLVPPATLKLDLRAQVERMPSRPKPQAPKPVLRGRAKSDPVAGGSWWAARAQAGEVTAGFSREEIMRPAKDDPRGESGVFTRVAGLLRGLSVGLGRDKILCSSKLESQAMKKLSILGLFLLLVLPVRAEIIEQVLVKVNGDIITKTDLEQRQIAALRERANKQVDAEALKTDEGLRKALAEITPALLVEAIDELLLVQLGREKGYRLSDDQFKEWLQGMRKDQNLLDDERFALALKQEGMTIDDLRKNVERRFLIQQVQRDEVGSKLSITEEEARQYYLAHKDQFVEPAHITLREILIEVPTSTQGGVAGVNVAQDDEAKAKAEAVRARLAAGEDFAKVAAEVSAAASKANGGLIGPINIAELSETLQQTIEKMKPGEISQPVRVARGFHIFRLETMKSATTPPFEQVRDLVADRVHEDRQRTEVAKFLSRMRGQALIEWKNEDLKKAYERQIATSTPGAAGND